MNIIMLMIGSFNIFAALPKIDYVFVLKSTSKTREKRRNGISKINSSCPELDFFPELHIK